MSTISSSIQMMDKLTAPVMRMAGAMSNLVNIMETADNKSIDPKGLDEMRNSIARANAELENFTNELTEADQKTQQNTAKQQQWNKAISGGGNAMNGILEKLKTAIGLYAMVNGAKKLMGISDEVMTVDARLNLITDNAGQKNNLKNEIYRMAQEARVPLNSFSNDVAKLGILAGKRFSGNGEIVQFMGNAAKAFKVAGTSASETAGAMTQLNQALASGVLQGDEFRSIRENAPLITQAIAKEMGVSQDHLKQLASEGKITADIVKNAVLGMTDDISRDFSKLPMTWGEVWTMAGNFALRTLSPLLSMINRVANSEKFQIMASEVANSFEIVAGVMTAVFETALSIAGWVYEKWDILKFPIMTLIGLVVAYGIAQGVAAVATGIYNVAQGLKAAAETAASGATFMATMAQHGLNAAIYAFPGTWIVAAVIAAIIVNFAYVYAMISVIKYMLKTATVTGVVVGAFYWMGAIIWNIIAWIVNTFVFLVNGGIKMANGVIDCINGMISGAAKGLSDFVNIFIDAFNWIMREADKFINGLLNQMQGLAPLLEVVGISMPTATGGALQLSRASFSAPKIGHIGLMNGGNSNVMKYKDPGAAYMKGSSKGDFMQKNFEHDILNGLKGAKDGIFDGLGLGDLGGMNGMNGMNGKNGAPAGLGGGKGGGGDVGKNTGDTARNTGKMADSLEDTEEEMKYLRELAEQEHINQFTTAEIKVEMSNNNTIEKDADIDDVIKKLTEKIEEKMNTIAEGVYD